MALVYGARVRYRKVVKAQDTVAAGSSVLHAVRERAKPLRAWQRDLRGNEHIVHVHMYVCSSRMHMQTREEGKNGARAGGEGEQPLTEPSACRYTHLVDTAGAVEDGPIWHSKLIGRLPV